MRDQRKNGKGIGSSPNRPGFITMSQALVLNKAYRFGTRGNVAKYLEDINTKNRAKNEFEMDEAMEMMENKAGYSITLEAAALCMNGVYTNEDNSRTQGVCGNATKGKAKSNIKSAPLFYLKKANVWKRPHFISFEDNREDIEACFEDRVVSADEEAMNKSLERLDKALVGKLLGRRIPFGFLNTNLHLKC